MKTVIVIPAYNEEKIIQDSVLKVLQTVRKLGGDIDIALVDNNSSDNTRAIMMALEAEYSIIKAFSEPRQGKGYAVFGLWEQLQDKYDIFGFMDADLATDLKALKNLLEGIGEGNDIVIGSRFLPGSRVKRGGERSVLSKMYHRISKRILCSSLSDFSCGFKAVSKKVVHEIVPQVKDRSWFFDTELLYRAEQAGYSIKEIPVSWSELRKEGDRSRLYMRYEAPKYLVGLFLLRIQKK